MTNEEKLKELSYNVSQEVLPKNIRVVLIELYKEGKMSEENIMKRGRVMDSIEEEYKEYLENTKQERFYD